MGNPSTSTREDITAALANLATMSTDPEEYEVHVVPWTETCMGDIVIKAHPPYGLWVCRRRR
jgi:hypothetical protein